MLLALCAALLLLPATAAAVSPDDLLPVDEAFRLQASAAGPGAIELRWEIADGYYLYRHRTSAEAGEGFDAGALRLPDGIAHEDEFFGPVETYRDQLVATLPGTPRGTGTTLTVKYQGCADLGICYPPQTRTVEVALPGGARGRLSGLLSGGLGSNSLPGGNTGGLLGGGNDPLPEQQAFSVEAIADGGNGLLVRLAPAPGYYIYRDQTGFKLPGDGLAVGAVDWPRGVAHNDEFFGDTTVYRQPVDVPVEVLREHPGPLAATLVVSLQGCQDDGICYPPMTRTLEVSLPAGELRAAAAAAPVGDAPPPAGDGADGAATAEAGAPESPEAAGKAADGTPAAGSGAGSAVERSRPPAGVVRGGLAEGGPGLLAVLLLAVIGGLILNLMPCVLPVLSLKALSLASGDGSHAGARRQALWYTAGVLASFAALGALALGLRQAGLALGWGFQLQQPLVVALLALLMFALGLSLSGLWHVGGRWTGIGHGLATRSGPAGDFFTGVLAVVVATPCTAPFMGAALAWAFAAPPALAIMVFLALGVGLALPFLLIGLVPSLAGRLPRPGAWMDTFKQLLAFPLYLTAAWLVWVLARQRGADAVGLWLLAAVLLAFAAWAWTRSRLGAPRRWLPAVVLALLAMGWPLHAVHVMPRPQATAAAPDAAGSEPFSEARLAELRESGRPVFVNITADWCVTCKANERTVLARDGFRQALAKADAAYLVGDWTDVDPDLTRYLQRHGAVGVPLYVVYPASGAGPQVLPIVLTPETVREALEQAAGGAA
ncbi:thioredoxin family protein [Lysobacter sp. GX 14042]|uniref:protein-disulfide reductase DsbD family protein n=1 Tax=Lysobacter sp. GX 14042 TaxID=2907155 RepID=UPI001F41C7EB|nr:protein-disulfide reductase DsbD [Lysobacter sp. GX 14042]MCE7033384.1 thioredoxin family protein [Lysobacter sp. GX 14042]